MKKVLFAVMLAAIVAPAFAQVGVSISVGQPGFYGQLNIGGYPQPRVIYQQPVIVEQGPGYGAAPIYLRVPPGYERHWGRYCAEYRACGRRVYFVRNDWYNHDYAPRYRREHEGRGHDQGEYHDHGRGHGHGHDDHGHQDHGHHDD